MKILVIENKKITTVQIVGVCETLEFKGPKRFLKLWFLFNIIKITVFILKQCLVWGDTKIETIEKISENNYKMGF